MLIKAKALNWTELGNENTIDQIKENCISHFLCNFYKVAVEDVKLGEGGYIKNVYERIERAVADNINISLDTIEAEFNVKPRTLAESQYGICRQLSDVFTTQPDDIKSDIYSVLTKAPEGFSESIVNEPDYVMIKAAELFVKTHNHLCSNYIQNLVIHIVKIADVTYYYYTFPGTENLRCTEYKVTLPLNPNYHKGTDTCQNVQYTLELE